LSKDLRFLEKLLDSNIAVLPETSQALVFDTVLERILIVRTFELWNTNNVVRQIRQLFEYALPHPASWRLLIAAVEKLPLSKEAVKAIKTACSGLSAQPPQDREAQQIRQRIERLKPVSLLETLTYFLKG